MIMEVKERVIHQIERIDDDQLLEQLELIIADLQDAQSKPYELDDAMIASIEKSEREFEEGKEIEHREAMESIKEWLKERRSGLQTH
jgi:predicted transcriptional regulator